MLEYILVYNGIAPRITSTIPQGKKFQEWGDPVLVRRIDVGFVASTPSSEDPTAVFEKGLNRLVKNYGETILDTLELLKVHREDKFFVEDPTTWEKDCYLRIVEKLR